MYSINIGKYKVHLGFGEIFIFLAQAVIILFFGLFVIFSDGQKASSSVDSEEEARSTIQQHYPLYLDVHVMIFIGFGFLMVFLKSYSWSAVGFNMIIAAYAFEWCILTTGFWALVCNHYNNSQGFHKFDITVHDLLFTAEFGAGAILITFGALLGKCSLLQLFVIASIEMIFYSLNVCILLLIFYTLDIGGAMTIHCFGAYFGLAATYFFQPKKATADVHNKNGGTYNSNLIAMIGTVFLFIFWPSFNGAIGKGAQQTRACISTLLSITTSTITANLVALFFKEGKLDMEVMLNATLAGGVIMGAAADLITRPHYAMIAGFCIGGMSAFGFCWIGPFLKRKIGLNDTCGVHNLHGIPGFLGGITSAICINHQSVSDWGDRYSAFFNKYDPTRDSDTQAGYQLAGLALSFGLAIFGGILAGFIASRKCFEIPEKLFDDSENWLYVPFPRMNYGKGEEIEMQAVRLESDEHQYESNFNTQQKTKGKEGPEVLGGIPDSGRKLNQNDFADN